MEDYLNISQAAKILGVSAGTLRRWDKAGTAFIKKIKLNLLSRKWDKHT